MPRKRFTNEQIAFALRQAEWDCPCLVDTKNAFA